MANTPKFVDATFYVQVEPQFGWWDRETVAGAKAVRMTMRKPNSPVGGTVMAKVTLRIPVAAFRPLVPEAVVVVPDTLTATPIEVTATDPNEEA